VRHSREDVPSDTGDPVFPVHFGLDLTVSRTLDLKENAR